MEAFPIMNGVNFTEVVEKYYPDKTIENMGSPTSYVWYGPRWANAGSAPSRGFKSWSSEGAIRCPCIVRYPPAVKRPQEAISHEFTNVMDIMPTILELAGIEHPGTTFRGRPVVSMRGKSWVPYLTGKAEQVYDTDFDWHGWELFGNRAVRKGHWKALLMPVPRGIGDWELFDLEKDPGEVHDLAKAEPAKLRELIAHYELYYQETGMFDASLAHDMAIQRKKTANKAVPGYTMHGYRTE